MENHRTIPSNMIAEVAPRGSGIPAKPLVNNDGHLIVDVQNQNDQATEKTIYNEISSLAKNIETNVVSFTVPTGKTIQIKGGSANGMTDATFRFYINGILKEKLENAWTQRNVKFAVIEQFTAEHVVKITVEHRSNQVHNFNGSIFYTLR